MPLVAIPLALAIGFAFLQILPLPAKMVQSISPISAQLRSELTSDQTLSQESQNNISLSLYPSATRGDLVLLTLGITVFALGYVLFASSAASRILLVAVALNGMALACVGLVQEVAADPHSILWFTIPAGGPFATFVNQNHAGGYLNLCLACAVGTLVWAWRRSSTNEVDERPSRERTKLFDSLTDAISRLNGSILFSLSLIAFLIAAIVCSLSRGAFIGMCVATLVATLVYRTRRGAHRALLGAVAIAAGIGLVAWLGLGEIVTDRLATLFDREAMAEHSLLEHWPVAARAIPDFWLTGSGLGTYGYIYGLYLDGPIGPWFIRAENQYLEALVDGGIIGFLLLFTALVLVWLAAIGYVRRAGHVADTALAASGIFAIGSQTITAAFDFGLYAPANLMLFAILCGPVVRRAIAIRPPLRSFSWLRMPEWRFAPAIASVILLFANGFCYFDIRTAASAESARLAATWDRPIEVLETAEFEHAIERLTPIAESRPGDANVQLRLAELWIDLYRLRAAALLRADAPVEIGNSVLWNLTSPVVLHRQLHDFSTKPETGELESLRTEPTVTRHLVPAYRHLQRARAACPLFPRVHLRLAELCGLDADPSQDVFHIHRACSVAPGDPDIWFHAGVLDAQAGRNVNAMNAWRHCLLLSDQYVNIVLYVAEPVLNDTQLVEWLLPPKPEMLLHLAKTRYAVSNPDPHTIRDRLLARAADLVHNASANPAETTPLDAPARSHLLGAIYAEQGNLSEALTHYRTAIASRPFELEWQYEFAQHLVEAGQLDEALDLARRCIRLAPKNRRYQKLLQQIRTTQLSTSALDPNQYL